MSIKIIYKLMLVTWCILSSRAAMASEIPNYAIRRFRAPIMLEGIRYTQRVRPGSPCDQVLVAAQVKLGRELTDEEMHSEYARLASEFYMSFEATAGDEVKVLAGGKAFAWFTLIRTASGLKLIQDLQAGESILTYDQSTGLVGSAKISAVVLFDQAIFDLYDSADARLFLGSDVRLATGSRDSVVARPAGETKWRRVLRAHVGGGQVHVRSRWYRKTFHQTMRIYQGMHLMMENNEPFFANDILVFSYPPKDKK